MDAKTTQRLVAVLPKDLRSATIDLGNGRSLVIKERKRPGRKALGKIQVPVAVQPETLRRVTEAAKAAKMTRVAWIEQALLEALKFCLRADWRKASQSERETFKQEIQ